MMEGLTGVVGGGGQGLDFPREGGSWNFQAEGLGRRAGTKNESLQAAVGQGEVG